ncbi:uncharacterized protein LOC134531931 isoform X2 [Bacillus rossius redtenbacheri]|uniref:uncharacterized protein LOC134531931 isoform X2 n=1 Tax=Bacillus rossius redtenbacheri TaxID=93214 RepID=UPI002FDC8C79
MVCDLLDFHRQLAGAGRRLVVVMFAAAWCGACRKLAPGLEEVTRRFPAAVFLKFAKQTWRFWERLPEGGRGPVRPAGGGVRRQRSAHICVRPLGQDGRQLRRRQRGEAGPGDGEPGVVVATYIPAALPTPSQVPRRFKETLPVQFQKPPKL